MSACPRCLRRAWLVAQLAGHLEVAWRSRRPLKDILALGDDELIAALAGRHGEALTAAYTGFDPDRALAACTEAAATAVCLHDPAYPERLRTGPGAPAVLHLVGDPARLEAYAGGTADAGVPAVAVVGTRRASDDALQVAETLGRGLAVAGVTVVSGMALGVDSAAHAGALAVGGPTIAVLACGPERAYPRGKALLHRQLSTDALVVSELPPGTPPWRWSFPARNRIIAALGWMTVVVEAAERSGSLITADFANDLGREVGAVPGRAWSPRSRGSNGLLQAGAHVILEVRDVLDAVAGAGLVLLGGDPPPGGAGSGAATACGGARRGGRPVAAPRGLAPLLAAALQAVAEGDGDADAVTRACGDPGGALGALAELELLGLVRRAPGGRWIPTGPVARG